ncbi:MAG: crossover junction endodeoxyribonuclease RuvC [Candidatus Sungbacteria bacterium]|nr:crossover junction endodeoxyribonuclease RuvC [Candidatus Sungbacteria bacterium]
MVKRRDNNLTILGIDPGTTRLGYAVVSGTSSTPLLVASGVIGDKNLSKEKRLWYIHREFLAIIKKFAPDVIALEKLFFSKNVKTAMMVAEARGVILLTAQSTNLKVYEYAPQEIKIALTSRGNADKKQVAAMVKAILKMNYTPRWDDESDAMAIAITGLVYYRVTAKGRT